MIDHTGTEHQDIVLVVNDSKCVPQRPKEISFLDELFLSIELSDVNVIFSSRICIGHSRYSISNFSRSSDKIFGFHLELQQCSILAYIFWQDFQ